MAAFSGEAWEGLMNKASDLQKNSEPSDKDLDLALQYLQRLLERKVRIFWHRKFFHKYIDQQIVPFGLRIQIFPNLNKIDNLIKQKWEENLQTCSIAMMTLLAIQYSHDIDLIDNSIKKWYDEYAKITSTSKFKRKESELSKHIENYTLEIIRLKQNKLTRDSNSYSNGSAYKWPTDGKNKNKFFRASRPSNRRDYNDDETRSSASSTSFPSNHSTIYRDLSGDRLPKRRKSDLEGAAMAAPNQHLSTPLPPRTHPISNQVPVRPLMMFHHPPPPPPLITPTPINTSLSISTSSNTSMSTTLTSSFTKSAPLTSSLPITNTNDIIISPSGAPLPADLRIAPIFLGKDSPQPPNT
ncbi:uncharacterized protein LOC143989087 [Lithobates pipiens]